ncbi:hypothetical protein QH494_19025 [Sphingomonas sp. AR_OL41]|uniref:hypothetical protein n=1 Tax=Sphingomonas sp. AR_OL41 TaxID=3042729 RepID=UPI002480F661|nr:hypothetical protein [Sphingomonas sp. AR_OL41]MDH7974286.1 hypothetical protein [Sphingomonas sp. AR_OL41]
MLKALFIAVLSIGMVVAVTTTRAQNAPATQAHSVGAAKAYRPQATGPDCVLPTGWAQVERRRPRYVVFGEMHGSTESPAFVGTVACALAARGERILVAVEHGSTNDAAFQAAWRLPHEQFAVALQKAGWAGRTDGVASTAMLALLVRLHALKEQGAAIGIVAFNGARDDAQRARFGALPGQGPHEAAQAENIRDAAGAQPYDHVLVLVGNLHAGKRPVERGGFTFSPMVMQLAPPEAVVSLDMRIAGGALWNCRLKQGVVPEAGKPIPGDAVECGSHPTRDLPDLHRTPFVSLQAFPHEKPDIDYDGFFWLGKVTASPPAVPDH